jgi:hypothetical protein
MNTPVPPLLQVCRSEVSAGEDQRNPPPLAAPSLNRLFRQSITYRWLHHHTLVRVCVHFAIDHAYLYTSTHTMSLPPSHILDDMRADIKRVAKKVISLAHLTDEKNLVLCHAEWFPPPSSPLNKKVDLASMPDQMKVAWA